MHTDGSYEECIAFKITLPFPIRNKTLTEVVDHTVDRYDIPLGDTLVARGLGRETGLTSTLLRSGSRR